MAASAHLAASSQRSLGAHPGRLSPADAAHASRASMECPAGVELVSPGRREHARDLDQIRCLARSAAQGRSTSCGAGGRYPKRTISDGASEEPRHAYLRCSLEVEASAAPCVWV